MKKITLVSYQISLYTVLTATYLRSRFRTVRTRAREMGASTVEWAIIAAISVIMATLIGGVIYKVVSDKTDSIKKCDTAAPSATTC